MVDDGAVEPGAAGQLRQGPGSGQPDRGKQGLCLVVAELPGGSTHRAPSGFGADHVLDLAGRT